MAKLINGKTAYKVGLHIHTTRSDGKRSYEDVIALYKENGYDAVAVTDHWVWNDGETADGVTVLSGAEFNIGGSDAGGVGVYHILGIGCDGDPKVRMSDPAQTVIDKIHEAGGIAVLAHPAWSLNTPEQIFALSGIDMTEIYNTVSAVHGSDRPYSGVIIDQVASRGRYINIHAADDSHHYEGEDACFAYVWVYAASPSSEDIKAALLRGDYFSTSGPELDVRYSDGVVKISSSPVSKLAIFSNTVWTLGHILRGEGITEMTYVPIDEERYIRVEATDGDGRVAWSNIVRVK